MDARQTTEQVTREQLAGWLFAVFLALDERGYRFSARELNALTGVTRWPDERLVRAVEFYEDQLQDYT